MTVLITGGAGFIGHAVARKLIETRGVPIILADSMSDTGDYDPALKYDRIKDVTHFAFMEDLPLKFMSNDVIELLQEDKIAQLRFVTHILHLAAEAGVGRGEAQPMRYVRSNVMAHVAMLELARRLPRVKKVVYASSSSVYADSDEPMSETSPLSAKGVYASTKRSVEHFSESYTRNYGIDQIGLRFFSVYGPWGRPDMAYWKFADAMLNGKKVWLDDDTSRDFTYIDDIVPTIIKMLFREGDKPAHRIYNLGSGNPRPTDNMMVAVQSALAIPKIDFNRRLAPAGVARKTWCDHSEATRDYDFKPRTPLHVGIKHFADWLLEYRKPK